MAQIIGRVAVAESSHPLADLEISVAESGRDDGGAQLAAAISDQNGRFTLALEERTLPTSVVVEVHAPDRGDEGQDRKLARLTRRFTARSTNGVVSIAIPAEVVARAHLPLSEEDSRARLDAVDADALERGAAGRLALARASRRRPEALRRQVEDERLDNGKRAAQRAFSGFELRRRASDVQQLDAGDLEAGRQQRDDLIARFQERVNASPTRSTFRLSEASLSAVQFGDNGTVAVSSDAFASMKASAAPFVDIVRRATVAQYCQKRRSHQQEADSSEDDDEQPALTADDVHASILRALDDQVQGRITSPGDRSRHDANSLAATMVGMNVATGPADATALHDYTHLRLLREPLTASAPNRSLAKNAELAFAYLTAFRDAEGLPPVERQFDDLESLDDLLRSISSDVVALDESDASYIELFSKGLPGDVQRALMDFLGKQAGGSAHVSRLRKLTAELREALQSPFEFQIVHPTDINFGLLTTYRQEWKPKAYQAGELVGTVPLAPGETRKIIVRTLEKKSRSDTEVDSALESRRTENDVKTSSHAEVARRAQSKTSLGFKTSAAGDGFFGQGRWNVSTSINRDSAVDSQSKKRAIRDATRKAADEFRSERKTEVKSEELFETTDTRETTISNPNNEISVTYLFYELQRRYEVTERIHSVVPVVLVPFDVPAPNEITDAWILRHDWILRRVMLDDQFLPALEYLRKGLSGDLARLGVLEAEFRARMDALREVKNDLAIAEAQVRLRQNELTSTMVDKSLRKYLRTFNVGDQWVREKLAAEAGNAPVHSLDELETWDARLDAAAKSLEFAEDDLGAMRSRQAAQQSAATAAREGYVEALLSYHEKSTRLLQLRLHVRDNILYYMQAIWDHEPPDQRWLRLRDKRVPRYTYRTTQAPIELTLTSASTTAGAGGLGIGLDGGRLVLQPSRPIVRAFGGFEVTTAEANWVSLSDVADLDEPLGYHGNCLVLRLTDVDDFIQASLGEYYCDVLGICDPDPDGDATPEELEELARCLKAEGAGDDDAASVAAEIEKLADQRRRTGRDSETIVLPSEHLFIEALPGDHPVLEDFKLAHRGVDLLKAGVELRQAELDVLRRAGRIVDRDYDDPEVDQHIVVAGKHDIGVDLPAGPDED